jgi:hypothetical protein
MVGMCVEWRLSGQLTALAEPRRKEPVALH